MRYKTYLRISDAFDAVEDWKRELITDEVLAEKLRKAYMAIVESREVKPTEISTEN